MCSDFSHLDHLQTCPHCRPLLYVAGLATGASAHVHEALNSTLKPLLPSTPFQEVLALVPAGTLRVPASNPSGTAKATLATVNPLREVVAKWKGERPLATVCAVAELLAAGQPAYLEAIESHARASKLTPLFAAAASSAPLELVATLLRLGTSAEARNSKSETPLHVALRSGAPTDSAVALLRAFPGAALVETEDRRTPLHCLAVAYTEGGRKPRSVAIASDGDASRLDLLEQLIAAGPAAVCVSDKDGDVPLSLAIENRAPLDAVKLLLAAVPPSALRAQLRETRVLDMQRVAADAQLKALLDSAIAAAAKSGDREGSSEFAGTGALEGER